MKNKSETSEPISDESQEIFDEMNSTSSEPRCDCFVFLIQPCTDADEIKTETLTKNDENSSDEFQRSARIE